MKYLFVLILILISFGCDSINRAQNEAKNLFIPIECNDELSGTGFPIASNLLMTAKHVGCSGSDVPSIQFKGKWIVEKDWTFNADEDIAIVEVDDVRFENYAHFRNPVLGEDVSGFGLPEGGLLSQGIIVNLDPKHFFATNIPIGGMSGSVIVGMDGKAVGMVVHGAPDHYVGGTLSGGFPGEYLEELTRSFKKYRELMKWKEEKGRE